MADQQQNIENLLKQAPETTEQTKVLDPNYQESTFGNLNNIEKLLAQQPDDDCFASNVMKTQCIQLGTQEQAESEKILQDETEAKQKEEQILNKLMNK